MDGRDGPALGSYRYRAVVDQDLAAQRAHADLNQCLEAEYERRSEAAATPGAALAGWDDFCRIETAKVNALHPRHTAKWVARRVQELTDRVDEATTPAEFRAILRDLAPVLPLAGITSEAIRWAIDPPVLVSEHSWPALVRRLPIAQDDLNRLFGAGLTPIALERDDLPFYNGNVPTEHQLIDADYGVATIYSGGVWRTPGIDLGMLARYLERSSGLHREPQHILEVGARRGQELVRGVTTDGTGPITRPIRSRRQLDQFLDALRRRADAMGLQMWLRGQPRHYPMPDVRDLAKRGLCPVRGVLDASQVPSMYRNVNARLEEPREYCRWLVQILSYYLFLRETLALPTAVARASDQEPRELLGGAWSWGTAPEFTIRRAIDGEVYEYADTHFVHGQVQAALFLQHYGIESNILDVTRDTDVALFFAQNEIADGRYIPATNGSSVIYVFLLDPELDRVASTSDLLNGLDVLRPLRQKCGVLGGASLIARNFCARFIAVRLTLEARIDTTGVSSEYLFPNPSEDRVLFNLQVLQDECNLDLTGPFDLRRD